MNRQQTDSPPDPVPSGAVTVLCWKVITCHYLRMIMKMMMMSSPPSHQGLRADKTLVSFASPGLANPSSIDSGKTRLAHWPTVSTILMITAARRGVTTHLTVHPSSRQLEEDPESSPICEQGKETFGKRTQPTENSVSDTESEEGEKLDEVESRDLMLFSRINLLT